MKKLNTLLCLLLVAWAFSAGQKARADRIILSPDGNTLPPKGFKTEFAISPAQGNESQSWLQVSTAQGIELEAQRLSAPGVFNPRYNFNLEYPLLPDFGNVPAVSVGALDIFNSFSSTPKLYLAVARTIPLSDRQLHILRGIQLNAGLGTGAMDGLFLGIKARLTAGLGFEAEYYRNKFNLSLALPVARNLQVKTYSLDGTIFYGLSYTLVR
jgi:hypothetical protein